MFLWSVTIISHKDCCCSVTQLAHQTSLSLNISQNVPNFLSIALVMSSSHLIFWHPLFLIPSIFPNIRDFSNESAVHIRWPRVSASALILLLSIQSWFPLRLTGLIFLLPKGLSRVFSSIIVWNHQFFGALPSLWSKTLTSIPNYWKDHSLDISDVFAFQYTIQVCHSFATVCKCAKSQRPITSQQ